MKNEKNIKKLAEEGRTEEILKLYEEEINKRENEFEIKRKNKPNNCKI